MPQGVLPVPQLFSVPRVVVPVGENLVIICALPRAGPEISMGLSEVEAAGALRFTLGPDTREEEIDALLSALPAALERARAAGLA